MKCAVLALIVILAPTLLYIGGYIADKATAYRKIEMRKK